MVFKPSATTAKLPSKLAEIPQALMGSLQDPDVFPPKSTSDFLHHHFLWCWQANIIPHDDEYGVGGIDKLRHQLEELLTSEEEELDSEDE